jgi:hypothetical protein
MDDHGLGKLVSLQHQYGALLLQIDTILVYWSPTLLVSLRHPVSAWAFVRWATYIINMRSMLMIYTVIDRNNCAHASWAHGQHITTYTSMFDVTIMMAWVIVQCACAEEAEQTLNQLTLEQATPNSSCSNSSLVLSIQRTLLHINDTFSVLRA